MTYDGQMEKGAEMTYDSRKFARALEKAGLTSETTDIVADALTEALTELETQMTQKTEDKITLAVERGVNRIILALFVIAGLFVTVLKWL